MNMLVKKVEDFRIYQIALQQSKEITEEFKDIQPQWKDKDVDQIIRSSKSTTANIAEGFSHRFYPKQFLRYLVIALGSSDETQHHLKILKNENKLNKQKADEYIQNYKYLSIKILNTINQTKKKHNIQLK